jgi:hypothetical protein
MAVLRTPPHPSLPQEDGCRATAGARGRGQWLKGEARQGEKRGLTRPAVEVLSVRTQTRRGAVDLRMPRSKEGKRWQAQVVWSEDAGEGGGEEEAGGRGGWGLSQGLSEGHDTV